MDSRDTSVSSDSIYIKDIKDSTDGSDSSYGSDSSDSNKGSTDRKLTIRCI